MVICVLRGDDGVSQMVYPSSLLPRLEDNVKVHVITKRNLRFKI